MGRPSLQKPGSGGKSSWAHGRDPCRADYAGLNCGENQSGLIKLKRRPERPQPDPKQERGRSSEKRGQRGGSTSAEDARRSAAIRPGLQTETLRPQGQSWRSFHSCPCAAGSHRSSRRSLFLRRVAALRTGGPVRPPTRNARSPCSPKPASHRYMPRSFPHICYRNPERG